MELNSLAAAGIMLMLMASCNLSQLTGQQATPTPEATQLPQTPTPEYTPPATQTPAPQETPTPQQTATPQETPTATPQQQTPTPAPTATPAPTVTGTGKVPIPNGDFESGTYEHWTVSGEGFGTAPSDMPQVNAQGMYIDTPYTEYQGSFAASSYLAQRDPGATGTLTSDAFLISRPYLEFLVTGMQNAQIYVELWVDGSPVKRLEPDNPNTRFARVSWNVTQWVGRMGSIKVFDGSISRPRGYIEVDDFYLTNTPTVTPT
jgi:hypothetical protein